MKVSVIITTYNEPEWLRKVIWGYELQTHKEFELIIADDGSGEETRSIINEFKNSSSITIKHIWHPDNGYRKCTILNKAILASESNYLIFSDGDCIPRKDFVETHVKHSKPGYFLSGGAVRLPMNLSHKITQDNIASLSAFSLEWLQNNGLPKSIKSLKLTQDLNIAKIMNFITPAKATWNGGNSSGWKKDILSVNGFNEDLHYGGQDREFGERLVNIGVKSKQIRYSAVCLHLDHKRPYKTTESIRKNKTIRRIVRKTKNALTMNGIIKLEDYNLIGI